MLLLKVSTLLFLVTVAYAEYDQAAIDKLRTKCEITDEVLFNPELLTKESVICVLDALGLGEGGKLNVKKAKALLLEPVPTDFKAVAEQEIDKVFKKYEETLKDDDVAARVIETLKELKKESEMSENEA